VPEIRNNDVVNIEGAAARVARQLLESGPATAPDLAERLGLSPTAVRRHLDSLEADGLVAYGERAPFGPARVRGRGRPARVYALTDAGRGAFDQAYDDLAVGALRFMADTGGRAAVLAFARHRTAELERRYEDDVRADEPTGRASELAAALAADGYAATVVAAAGAPALQLCQHHCPVSHVATEFPELCDAETEVFSRLLGRHVTRLATIAHGDGVCTTLVPTADTSARPSSVPLDERSPA
jgi:predicted ArsR family transcriptional regulator